LNKFYYSLIFCSNIDNLFGSYKSSRSTLKACSRCRYAREPEEESSEEEDDRQQQQGPKWGRLEILPGFVEIPTLQVGSSRTQVGQTGYIFISFENRVPIPTVFG
jgi:hypothetical protein